MLPALRGYGHQAIAFSGEASDFEVWSIRFKGMIRLNKLIDVLESDQDVVDADKNAQIFALLVQCLDDNSLNLVIRDAENKGRESFNILKEHFVGATKPRIMSLYCELTALSKDPSESVTEYLLRAETASSRLKQAQEEISDKLLIAMILKGLPESFLPFSTIINNSEDITFAKFKTQLRSYEENEAARYNHSKESDSVRKLTCSKCGKSGHTTAKCKPHWQAKPSKTPPASSSKSPHQKKSWQPHRKPRNTWCSHCRMPNHATEDCGKLRKIKTEKNYNVQDSEEEVIFKISVIKGESIFSIKNNDNYLIHCGATTHIISDESKLFRKDESFNPDKHTIELADNSRQTGVATARGDAKISITDNIGKSHDVTLKNVLCIPSFNQNILSVHCMTQNGLNVNFSEKESFIKTKSGTTFPIVQSGRLYFVKNIKDKIQKIEKSLEEWHYTLGHCNTKDIINLESISDNMKITNRKNFECQYCIEAKMTNKINREPDIKASKPLEMVHTDLCGPISPQSIQGARYAVVFVDDYSGLIKVYFIKNKNNAAKATAKYLADMAPHGDIKIIRSDNGGEFISKEYEDLLTANKIQHQFSSPHSPHQNGTAERSWRTLMETARALIFQSGLPKTLWTYAVRHAAYVRNRCYSKTHSNTPYAKFTGKSPHLGKMKIFGTSCHSLLQNPSKLDKRTQQGHYIGRDPESPAHLVYVGNKVVKSRNVTFSAKIPHIPTSGLVTALEEETSPNNTANGNLLQSNSPSAAPCIAGVPSSTSAPCGGAVAAEPPVQQAVTTSGQQVNSKSANKSTLNSGGQHNNSSNNRYPPRNRNAPSYLSDYETGISDDSFHDADYNVELNCVDYFCLVSDIPVTYNDSLRSDNANNWQTAMNEEYKSLIEMNTFDLVPRPSKKVIGGRWVFAMKTDEHRNPVYKARYVAKGFSQIPSIDYGEIFSPTARLTSIRILCQLAAQENLQIFQLDVKTAYLNADIDYDIYLEQPKGFEVYENGSKLVMKLNKSIYGLKQAGRMWNQLLHNYLIDENFVQSTSDHCVYTRNNNGKRTILIVWVDDIIIAASSEKDANQVKASLSERFRMKDFGIISNFIGIEFEIGNNTIKLHQSKYVQKILDRFKMDNCHPKSLPCDPSTTKIDFNEESTLLDEPRLFREIVGSLIYLMMCTRPDICYVVSILSQFMAKPTVAHLNLAKFVLKYLKGTMEYGLIYRPCEKLDIIGYTDASWASGIDRKSISGYCYKMSKAGALISWKSKKQPVVSLSTCESEYIAASYAIQESSFLQQLTRDIGIFPNLRPVVLFVDNMGSIQLAKNPVFHQRSKHLDTKYHHIRSKVNDGHVILDYVPSKENIADIFTKPCTKQSLQKFSVCSK